MSWTPDEGQGPSTNVVTVEVSDDGVPALSAVQSFTVTVLETNQAPVLAAVADAVVTEGTESVVTNVATDGDLPANGLVYSLGTNAPAGMTIDPGTGVLNWTPGEAPGSSTNVVTVEVVDDGVPALSAQQTFTVTVLETNQAPVLAAVTDVVLVEGTELVITNLATDGDLPTNGLVYSLGSNAPAGMTIDPGTGLLSWTPDEGQGPSTNVVTVEVADDGVPALSAEQTFTVTVLETNQAPVLAAVTDVVVTEGTELAITNLATDGDLPTNGLVYSLGTNAPAGMTIDPGTGLLSWTPDEGQGPSTNQVTVEVSDDGVPALSAVQSFTVTVLETNQAPVLAAVTDAVVTEGTELVITNLATDGDLPTNGLVYSLGTNAPAGMTIDPGTGLLSWTPDEGQGPSTNVVTVEVSDDGVPALSAVQSFTVTVLETNQAPVLAAVTDAVFAEGTELVITNLATDGDLPTNGLVYSLWTNAPAGMTIDPGTGLLSWTPDEGQGPSTNVVTVEVSDDGVPALSAVQSFTVTVLETNQAPVLSVVADVVVTEGTELVVTNVATDGDLPTNGLVYSLGTNAPAGMAIDPATGVVSWTPGEGQGPSTNQVTVEVSDDGVPALSALQTFTVTVLETNSPPLLGVLNDYSVHVGESVSFTVSASDSDLPANNLSFHLAQGAAVGAVLDATNGLFQWAVNVDAPPGTNSFGLVVADDGNPVLSSTGTFNVVVFPLLAFTDISASNGTVRLEWNSIPGRSYRLLTAEQVSGPWATNLAPQIATNHIGVAIDTNEGLPARFYRLELPR